MKTVAATLLMACTVGFSADPAIMPQIQTTTSTESHSTNKRLWWTSLALLGTASALDVQSSWGKPELNPLLRGADGRFGARGLAIKASVVGAGALFQWLVLRKHHDLEKTLAATNAGLAGWFTFAFVHNRRR